MKALKWQPGCKIMRTYCCSVCGKNLSSSVALTSHIKTHSGIKSFCCEYCAAMYSTKQNLIAHLIRMHDVDVEAVKECNICGKQFFRKSAFDSHFLIHSGQKPFNCNICNKNFRQKITRDLHLATHTGDYKYSCSKCDKKFLNSYKYKLHLQKHKDYSLYSPSNVEGNDENLGSERQNESSSIQLTRVRIGDMELNSKKKKSLKKDNTDFFCSMSQCSEISFRSKTLLKKHIRTNISHKNLTNNQVYCKQENFNKHCSGKSKCICHMCGKYFSNLSVLKHHSVSHSTSHDKSNEYYCTECNKHFKSLQGFEYHKKAHKGFYNFICEVCGKLFIRNSHFLSHMKSHSNSRPYNCILCRKTYKSNKNLKEHMKIKHSSIS